MNLRDRAQLAYLDRCEAERGLLERIAVDAVRELVGEEEPIEAIELGVAENP